MAVLQHGMRKSAVVPRRVAGKIEETHVNIHRLSRMDKDIIHDKLYIRSAKEGIEAY